MRFRRVPILRGSPSNKRTKTSLASRSTAYKLLGRTHALSVSAAYQLTKRASVQLSYEYSITTHDPLEYEKHLVEFKIAVAY